MSPRTAEWSLSHFRLRDNIQGLTVGLGGLSLCLVGFSIEDLILWLSGFVVLFFWVFSLIQLALGFWWVQSSYADWNCSLVRLETGEWHNTGFSLNLPLWLLTVSVDIIWLSGRVRSEWVRTSARVGEEQILGLKRGLDADVTRSVVLFDIFRWWQVCWNVRTLARVEVHPKYYSMNWDSILLLMTPAEGSHSPQGDETEAFNMRSYQEGDPMNRILWRVFARTGQMMTRVPEKSDAPMCHVGLYLVTSQEDEKAAGLLGGLLKDDSIGQSWVLGFPSGKQVESQKKEALEAITASGDDPEAIPDLVTFSQALPKHFGSLMVFSGQDTAWAQQQNWDTLFSRFYQVIICIAIANRAQFEKDALLLDQLRKRGHPEALEIVVLDPERLGSPKPLSDYLVGQSKISGRGVVV